MSKKNKQKKDIPAQEKGKQLKGTDLKKTQGGHEHGNVDMKCSGMNGSGGNKCPMCGCSRRDCTCGGM